MKLKNFNNQFWNQANDCSRTTEDCVFHLFVTNHDNPTFFYFFQIPKLILLVYIAPMKYMLNTKIKYQEKLFLPV